MWALVFHNLVPLPLNPGVVGKKEARPGSQSAEVAAPGLEPGGFHSYASPPSRTLSSQEPEPWKGGGGEQRCTAPYLTDPLFSQGSGRNVASLQAAEQVGPALCAHTSTPRSLIVLLWLGQRRQIPLQYPYLTEVLETEVKFRGLEATVEGTRHDVCKVVGGQGLDCIQRERD